MNRTTQLQGPIMSRERRRPCTAPAGPWNGFQMHKQAEDPMSDDVRAAAERVRRVDVGEDVEVVYRAFVGKYCTADQAWDYDRFALADAYLAEHPATPPDAAGPDLEIVEVAEYTVRDWEENRKGHFTATPNYEPVNVQMARAFLALARRGPAAAEWATAGIDGIRTVADELATVKAERDKLQAFKTWTHDYLDRHGVPHHPPGTHGADGCRIGDRMDWLMAGRDRLRCVCESAIQCFGDEEGESAAAVLADIRDALALVPAPEAPK
jgi:hypothetical protein